MQDRTPRPIIEPGRANIIVFGGSPWDHPIWTNRQHVASRLAKTVPVLYVENSVGLTVPLKNPKLMRQWLKGPKRQGNQLWSIAPRWPLPGSNRSPRIRRWDELMAREQVIDVARGMGFQRPILWFFQTYFADYLGNMGERMVVYHCTDEYSTQPGYPPEWKEKEDTLLRTADVVFCTAQGLYERKRQVNPHTYYMPNVGDTGHFAKARSELTPIAPAIAGIKRPILGFIGAIDAYKIDFALIRALATSHPEWSIVLLGPIGVVDGTDQGNLPQGPNIHYLGAIDYQQLPTYLRVFDVCLIPYNLNDYTATVFPLKFHEYLATGLPVVSTNLPSLSEYADLVHLATDHASFISGVEQALATKDDETAMNRRLAVAAQNSWDARVEALLDTVDKEWERKNG